MGLQNNTAPSTQEDLGISLVTDISEKIDVAAAARALRYFPVFEADREFTVTPVLTPDNYLDAILPMVQNAKKSIYIENQTFNAPSETQDDLAKLTDLLIALSSPDQK